MSIHDSENLFDIVQEYRRRGKLSRHMWQRFLCECCREVWDKITNPTLRQAINVVEESLIYGAYQVDMQIHLDGTLAIVNHEWQNVASLRLPRNDTSSFWPLTEAVDDAWVRYLAADAVVQCFDNCSEEISFTTMPESAASIRPWSEARRLVVERTHNVSDEELRYLVEQQWLELNIMELNKQISLFNKLMEL